MKPMANVEVIFNPPLSTPTLGIALTMTITLSRTQNTCHQHPTVSHPPLNPPPLLSHPLLLILFLAPISHLHIHTPTHTHSIIQTHLHNAPHHPTPSHLCSLSSPSSCLLTFSLRKKTKTRPKPQLDTDTPLYFHHLIPPPW